MLPDQRATEMNLTELMSPARWFRMTLLAALGILAIYVEAAPLGLAPGARPSPDLLLCVVAYWAVRRPGSSPILLVFLLGLTRDLLTDVPVGAGALSLVLVAETLKTRRRLLARAAFPIEWLTISIAALLTAAMNWGLVLLTLAQPPYLSDIGAQVLFTALVYPFVVLVLRWVLRISWRKTEVMA